MAQFLNELYLYSVSCLSFVIELEVGILFFLPNIRKTRENLVINIIIAIIINIVTSLSCYFIVRLFTWNIYTNILIYLLMFVGSLFSNHLIFDYKLKNMLLIVIASYSLQHLKYQTYRILFEIPINYQLYEHLKALNNTYYISLLFFGYTILFYVLSYFLFSKKLRTSFHDGVNPMSIFLISSFTLTMTIFLNSFALYFSWGNFFMLYMTSAFCILCCLLILFIIFFAYSFAAGKMKTLEMDNYYKEKLRQYEIEKKNLELFNIKYHDLKKIVRDMEENNMKPESLESIKESLTTFDASLRTGNDIIDTILQQKNLICSSKKIDFTSLIDGKVFSFMKKEDIYSLFTNIIDNAIEAVEPIEDEEKRFVSLTAMEKNSLVIIEETNYYQGRIIKNSDGTLKTSKSNDDYHGFGTKSIRMTAERYNGKFEYQINEDRLTLTVIIPIP